MERIVKIAIYVAVLFAASIWISSVFKSCNNTSTDLTETSVESENLNELDDFEEGFFEEEFEDDFEEDEQENFETQYESDMGGGVIESTAEEEFDTDFTKIEEEKENHTPSRNKTVSRSGKYMVLAGSYLIEDNASIMVNRLNKIGYNSAEIVIFNMSQYHSVCADRLSDYNEAVQLSNELKRNGIDNYIHTKQ